MCGCYNFRWNVIGYIPKARALPGVVRLDDGSKTVIVGGQSNSNTYMDETEIIEAKN